MLGSFRKLGDTWLVKGFLLVLVGSFALWGIGDYLNGSSNSSAFAVGETRYSGQKVAEVYEQQLQNISQRFGQQLTPEQALQFGLPSYTLGQLMQEAALLNTANELDIVAAPSLIQGMIQNMPDFQNEEGAFDVNTYRQMLRTIGTTPERFEADQSRGLKIQTLAAMFNAPALPQALQAKLGKLETTQAHISYVQFDAADIPDVPLTNDELKTYYTANQSQYATPEVRDVDALLLDIPTFADTIELTDADLQDAYDNADSLQSPEKRRIRYALFATEQDANTAQEKLAAGATFASLKPIDMGLVEQTALPEAFAKAVFDETIHIGAATPVFEGPVGFHIAMVDEIIPASLPSFEEAKATLSRQLKQTRALETQLNVLEQVEDLLASGATLQEVAEATKLPLTTTENATQKDLPANQQAAFTLAENQPSDVQDVGDDAYMVLQTRNIRSSRIPELKDVRAAVWADAQAAKKALTVQAQIKDMMEVTNARGLAYAGQVFGLKKLPVQTGIAADMRWLTEEHKQLALSKKPGFTLGNVKNGALYIMKLDRIETPEMTADIQQALQAFLQRRMAATISAAFIGQAAAEANVAYNLPLLRQIFGEGFTEQMIPRP